MKPSHKESIENARKIFTTESLFWLEYNNGYHFKVGTYDYWPTTGKWQDDKRNVQGIGIRSFLEYFENECRKKPSNQLSIEQMFTIAKKVKPMNLEKVCEALHKEIYG